MKTVTSIKQEIIKYGQMAEAKNLTPGTSGNISARLDDKIIITSSGSANGYLTEEDFAVIDLNGNIVEGNKKPSSEKLLHCEFYKQRKDIEYIIHVHSPYLSSFASAGLPLDEPVMAENVFYFGQIPLAEYGLPSSTDLVEKTAKYFKDYSAILMANHGFITGDKTIQDAFFKLTMAESYAQVVLNTKILGGAKVLNSEQVNEILELKKNL